MFFVFRVGLFEPVQHQDFLETSLVPVDILVTYSGRSTGDAHSFLVTHDLDRNLFTSLSNVPSEHARSNYICKHSLAESGEHLVATAI